MEGTVVVEGMDLFAVAPLDLKGNLEAGRADTMYPDVLAVQQTDCCAISAKSELAEEWVTRVEVPDTWYVLQALSQPLDVEYQSPYQIER